MNSERLIVAVAAIAAIVSLVSTGFVYYSISSLQTQWITGFVAGSTNASVNLTVNTQANINFTNLTINWGAGSVNATYLRANLTTSSGGATDLGGSWYINAFNGSNGFVLQNIGNTNVTVCLATSKTAATFLGGTGPAYMYNFTQIEVGSCLNATGGTHAGGSTGMAVNNTFVNVNSTQPGTQICGIFQFVDSADELRIDVHLSVPYDSLTGSLTDTFTANFNTGTTC